MELDDTQLAIGRIESALSRLERTMAARGRTRAPDLFTANGDSAEALADVQARHARLKAEIATAITDIDMILSGHDRG